MLAEHRALDLRHLGDGPRRRPRRARARRQKLVPDHRRLCVRSGSGKAGERRSEGGRRPGAWQRPPPTRGQRLLILPAPGASLRRPGDRARQCRRRHRQHDQAGRRVQSRREAEDRRADLRSAKRSGARPEDGARHCGAQRLLLGFERQDPRLVGPLSGAAREEGHAEPHARRRLFGNDGLPQCGGPSSARRPTDARSSRP